MRLLITLLCLVFCGQVFAQTIQETVNRRYSPWSVSGFSLISSESDQVHSGGSLNSYNFVGPNYRLSSHERLAFKAAFTANTAGYNRFGGECSQQADGAIQNPFFEYNNYNVGLLPGIANVFWSGRVYLPISKISRNRGTIGRYDSNTIITRYITQRLFAEFRNDVAFYHQSKSTYFGSGPNDQCEIVDYTGPSNTRAIRMENWLSMWYRYSSRWSFGGSFLVRDDFFNSSSTETSRQRNGRMHEITAFIGPSIRYTYSFNASFILSFRDKIEYSGFHPERKDDLVELGEFRARNSELSLLSFIRF